IDPRGVRAATLQRIPPPGSVAQTSPAKTTKDVASLHGTSGAALIPERSLARQRSVSPTKQTRSTLSVAGIRRAAVRGRWTVEVAWAWSEAHRTSPARMRAQTFHLPTARAVTGRSLVPASAPADGAGAATPIATGGISIGTGAGCAHPIIAGAT